MTTPSIQQGIRQPRRSDRIEQIPLEFIFPNPYQPRRFFSEQSIEELARSILQYGLLQPITVRCMGAREYELVSGERRLRAAKLAGYDRISAIVVSTLDTDSAMLAMIENLQREDLHFLEEAEGYLSLLQDHGLTQEELARRMGKSQSTIANKLRVLRLPDPVKQILRAQGLTERHARALLRLHEEEDQLAVARRIAAEDWTVRDTENYVESELRRVEAAPSMPRGNITRLYRDHRLYINAVQKTLKQLRGAGVTVDCDVNDYADRVEMRITLKK